jgi:hypothetical protein
VCRLGVEAGRFQGVAKSWLVNFHEGQALGLQVFGDRAVQLRDVGAFVQRGAVQFPRDDRLRVGRQRREAALVGKHPEPVPHVAGHRDVFLHFVQFGDFDQGQRVFLALGNLGLQRRVDLGEVDADGGGAERLEHAGPQRRDWHADLKPLQIGRGGDRVSGAGDLAEAVVPHIVHGSQAALVDLRPDIGAEPAVHRLPHRIVVIESEAHAVDRRLRHQGGQDQAGQGEEVHRAGA